MAPHLDKEDLSSLGLFRAQYFQALPLQELRIPPDSTLRKIQSQDWIFRHMFNEDHVVHLPQETYRARVLKQLVTRIEAVFEDAEEDEISDDLIESLTVLLGTSNAPESADVQQKSFVTYSFPRSAATERDPHAPSVTILEARSVISAQGTTGLRTWEAALHLTKYLALNGGALIRGKNVLELGAGTGLVSLFVAKYLKPSHVAVTDGDEAVVDSISTNMYLNGLESSRQMSSLVLRWGRMLSDTQFAAEEPFDVVLGADITYDSSLSYALVQTLRDLIEANPQVSILIAATIRNEDTFKKFLNVCTKRRLVVKDVDLPEEMSDQTKFGPFYPRDPPVRLIQISTLDSIE